MYLQWSARMWFKRKRIRSVDSTSCAAVWCSSVCFFTHRHPTLLILVSLSSLILIHLQILCTGSNPYNEDESKDVVKSVTLNVKHTPKWNGTEESKVRIKDVVESQSRCQTCTGLHNQILLLVSQRVAKPIGQETLLHCNVVANPNKDLSFVWYFNGETIDAGNVREIKVGNVYG